MTRTKRQRAVDAAIHWAIATAIAGTIGTALMYKVVRDAKAVQEPECGGEPCHELIERMAVIEKKLEVVEPELTGSHGR